MGIQLQYSLTMCSACAYLPTSDENFIRVIFDLASYSIYSKVTYDPEKVKRGEGA
jgi:hypothetical protein